jgi:hypothetical protein
MATGLPARSEIFAGRTLRREGTRVAERMVATTEGLAVGSQTLVGLDEGLETFGNRFAERLSDRSIGAGITRIVLPVSEPQDDTEPVRVERENPLSVRVQQDAFRAREANPRKLSHDRPQPVRRKLLKDV